MVQATLEQQKAIDIIGRDLTVAAGAGSGKTWVLTQKYVELLEQGYHPEEIVVITFTEKAAAEMKVRIRKAVNQRLLQEEETKKLSGIIAWKRHRQGIEQSVISTIHGFCSRVLKENPLAAWVDPNFRILDELKSSLLLEEAIIEALEEDLGDKKLTSVVARKMSPKKLVKACQQLYPKLLEQEVAIGQLVKSTKEVAAVRQQQLVGIISQLDHEFQELESLKEKIDRKTKSYGGVEELLSNWPGWKQHLMERAQSGVVDDKFVLETIVPLLKPISRPVKVIKDVVGEIGELTNQYLQLFTSQEYSQWIDGVGYLLLQAHLLYQKRKRAEGSLDFMDLQLGAIRLLRSNKQILEKYAQRYKMLMVDEFQDTNIAQKNLLHLLLKNGDTRLMVVGDEKQSIYRFRGADVAVFRDVEQEISTRGGETVPLAMNFRTQEPIINFINHCFQQLMDDTYQPLLPHRSALGSQPKVQLIIQKYGADQDINRNHMLVEEAAQIASAIEEMVGSQAMLVAENQDQVEVARAVSYGDITILLSTMSNIHLYELALLKLKIPFYILGSRGFFQRQEIIDLTNALKLVVDPTDEGSLVATLRSPLVGISDETIYFLSRAGQIGHIFYHGDWAEFAGNLTQQELEKLELAKERITQWQRSKIFLTVEKLVEKIMADTEYLSIILSWFSGQQSYGNMHKMLLLAKRFDEEPQFTILDFVHYLTEMQSKYSTESQAQTENEASDTVKIMTIHQSKGLEFPVVFLPDLSREFIFDRDEFIYDQELGLGLKMYDSSQREWPGDGLYREIKAREDLRTMEEEKRKLYVAMTRARDYLVLVGSYKERKKERENSLADKNWLAWLLTILPIIDLDAEQAKNIVSCPQNSWHLAVVSTTSSGEGDGNSNPYTTSRKQQTAIVEYQNVAKPSHLGQEWSGRYNSMPAISVTGLLEFYDCQRKFYFSRVEKLPQALVINQMPAAGSISSEQLGILSHKVLELLPQEFQEKDVASFVEAISLSHGLVAPLEQVVNWIKSLHSSKLIGEMAKATVDYREMPFRLQFGSLAITGVIDRLARLDDKVYILDYKANRLAQGRKKALVEYYSPQLKLYSLVVTHLLDWPAPKAYLVFLQDQEPVEITYSYQELDQYYRNLEQLLQWLNKQPTIRDFAKCEAKEKCIRCGYNHICHLGDE